jgi:formiminotetrahydrofolate cyclodeaminase
LEENYLKLPADQLLEKFGEGSHVPGSGSAAAFSGLLGVELMRTVCKLTLKREEDKYVQIRREFIIILEQVDKVKLTLVELFQKDASIFNDVSKYRTLRNEAKGNNNEKDERKYAKLANDKLKEATEIPLEIARTCLNLIDYGFTIFDKGFQSARGDSGVAISNLLSAISGSLFVTLLNIRTGRKSQWTEKLREDAEKIGQNYSTKQKLALTKVLDLYKEGIDIKDYQLKLSFE